MFETGGAVLRSDGERGGGEDDAGVVGEEGFGEQGGDVDGGGEEVGAEGLRGVRVAGVAGGVAEAAGGAAFDPEDGVGVGGFEEEFQVVANVGGALAEAGGFVDFAEAFEFSFETLEGVEGAEVGIAAGFEEVGAVEEFKAAEVGGADGEGGEEELGALADGLGCAFDGAGGDAFGAEHGFGVAG